jgi:hypothetical protein
LKVPSQGDAPAEVPSTTLDMLAWTLDMLAWTLEMLAWDSVVEAKGTTS